jgi:predicted nuclease of predicted toxin-antitoxin system
VAAGRDVPWMGEIPPDPGDEAVLCIAFDWGRVLITLDKDFGELAIVYGKPHRGIIRLVDLPARQQGTYSAVVLNRFAESCLAVPP